MVWLLCANFLNTQNAVYILNYRTGKRYYNGQFLMKMSSLEELKYSEVKPAYCH